MLIYIYHPGLHSPERAAGIARRLEELGYDGIAMPDHLFIPNFITGAPQHYAHGPTVLTTCAAVTSRIALVTLMANVLVRPPVELAHAVATLARVAGPGRVDLGVGTGWFRWEFEAAGLAFPPGRERRDRLVEAVGGLARADPRRLRRPQRPALPGARAPRRVPAARAGGADHGGRRRPADDPGRRGRR